MNILIKNFMQAPSIRLERLDNFFIELTHSACNLKCKHCYTKSTTSYNKDKDFLDIKKIKTALRIVKDLNVKMIYLTGGEPTIHPDFNQILRLSLKIASTSIITNGQTINEKKARFLRKIEDENNFESIYIISFDHYEELKNDAVRGRGSFRKALNAINSLAKYGFNPIIQTSNFYNEDIVKLRNGFFALYHKLGLKFEDINLKITPLFNNSKEETHSFEDIKADGQKLDCSNSRIFTSKGVFTCPALAGDFRARSGPDMSDFSTKCTLDTKYCTACLKFGSKAFSHTWV